MTRFYTIALIAILGTGLMACSQQPPAAADSGAPSQSADVNNSAFNKGVSRKQAVWLGRSHARPAGR